MCTLQLRLPSLPHEHVPTFTGCTWTPGLCAGARTRVRIRCACIRMHSCMRSARWRSQVLKCAAPPRLCTKDARVR